MQRSNQLTAVCCIFPPSTERFTDLGKPYGGLVLGSSQFSILHQLPPKILLNSKVIKIDRKIIISLLKSKFVTHSVVAIYYTLYGLRQIRRDICVKNTIKK
jgi:hypothetical protein